MSNSFIYNITRCGQIGGKVGKVGDQIWWFSQYESRKNSTVCEYSYAGAP